MRINHGSIVLLPKNVNYWRSDKEMHNRRFKINIGIPNICAMLKQRHKKIKKMTKKNIFIYSLVHCPFVSFELCLIDNTCVRRCRNAILLHFVCCYLYASITIRPVCLAIFSRLQLLGYVDVCCRGFFCCC